MTTTIQTGQSALRMALEISSGAYAQDDGRPVLTGYHVKQVGDDRIRFAAADGFALQVTDIPVTDIEGEIKPVIIDARSVMAAIGDVPKKHDQTETAALVIDDDGIKGKLRDAWTERDIEIVQGNYPTYDQLIPDTSGDEFAVRWMLDAKPFIRLLKALKSMDVTITRIASDLEVPGSLVVMVESEDSPLVARFRCVTEFGRLHQNEYATRLAFNALLMLRLIQPMFKWSAVKPDNRRLTITSLGPSSPMVISVDALPTQTVLMPMFVQWPDQSVSVQDQANGLIALKRDA